MGQVFDVVVSEAGELYGRDGVMEECFETSAAYENRDKARYERRAARLGRELATIAGPCLWITDRLCHFYYHWLCDALPRLEAALDTAPATSSLLLPGRVLENRFVRESLKAWPRFEVAAAWSSPGTRIGELVLTPRAAETPDVCGPLLRRVAERICAHFGGRADEPERRVYVSREGARIRRVANEKEIVSVLAARGFEFISAERMTFADQVRLMRQTRILVGAHGGALTNMLFMPAHGEVIELRREEGPPPCYRNVADALGHAWRALPCRAVDTSMHPHAADIAVDPQALDKALAKVIG